MANGHGGARPGAGRKRLSERFAGEIAAAEAKIAGPSRFLKYVDNLNKLADGGYLRVKEEWKPAGLVMVDVQATFEGEPLFSRAGAPIMVKMCAFPDLPPEQLVCVGKVTEIADRDRQANEYLLNRIMGRPTQSVELGNSDDGPLKIVVEYEDAGSPPEDTEAACGPGDDPAGVAPL